MQAHCILQLRFSFCSLNLDTSMLVCEYANDYAYSTYLDVSMPKYEMDSYKVVVF